MEKLVAAGIDCPDSLVFKELTLDTIKEVRHFLPLSGSRSCDFSIGGIYMWVECLKYDYCIVHDTLFLKGVMDDSTSRVTFSMPVGRLPLDDAIGLLRRYCKKNHLRLEFSAVPEERIAEFRALSPQSVSPLRHWADYVYDLQEMATFKGKRMGKKRNHANQFERLFPDWRVEPVGAGNLEAVRQCFREICDRKPAGSPMAECERGQVWKVLECPDCYGFESLCLIVGEKVVAFTFGEVVGDTLMDHVEKMLHDVPGSGEVVFRSFSAAMAAKYPQLAYVNREDDAGDEGLRRSKLSYNPVMMVEKYSVLFD